MQELWAAEQVVYRQMIQISYKIGVVKGEDINAGDGAVRKDGDMAHRHLLNASKSNQTSYLRP